MATLPASPAPKPLLPLAAAILAGFAAAAIVLLTINDRAVAIGFVAASLIAAAAIFAARRMVQPGEAAETHIDWSVAQALASASDDALAVTDRAGRLGCANDRFEILFAGYPTPPGLPVSDIDANRLGDAGRAAWRDGEGRVEGIQVFGAPVEARVVRIGEDILVWRFIGVQALDLTAQVQALIAGHTGDRMGGAGIMTALVTPEGRIALPTASSASARWAMPRPIPRAAISPACSSPTARGSSVSSARA